MIKIIEGNIVDAQTDYIIHQVNCQGEMNTGVAKALRDYDEGIYIHYRNVCKLREFNPGVLYQKEKSRDIVLICTRQVWI